MPADALQGSRSPDDRLLLSRTRADQVADYHQTGCNAHTGLKLIGGLNEPTAAITSKPRPYRSLGVVLVRPWIAEVDEDAVAHILRHEPAKALHSLGDALLVRRKDLAQVFRGHTRRERCRTDEVREHHCDLATLGGVPWGSGRYGGNGDPTHFWYAEMTSRRSSGVHTRRERCRTDEVREHHCDLATLGGVPWGSGRYGGNGNLRRILLAAGEFSYRSQQLESMT